MPPTTGPGTERAAEPAAPHLALPIHLRLDDSDSPSDVVDALFLGRFTSGEHPFARGASLDTVKTGLTLLPPDATLPGEPLFTR